jgi:hypothetical protein
LEGIAGLPVMAVQACAGIAFGSYRLLAAL